NAAVQHRRGPALRGPPLRHEPRRRGRPADPRHVVHAGGRRRAVDGDRLRRRAARAAADRGLHGGHPGAAMSTTIRHSDVMVDGMRLRVAEAGQGPTLILVHGLTASHAVWELTLAAFADRWRVIAPDLPGHGESDKPDAPYTIDFFAGMVRSL